jgi:hypothetical protein
MTIPFWKPPPKEPWSDWRTYSMLVPILFGTLGACIFMALGFSFTEMESVPPNVRTQMVVVAAFSVAIGSTFGSVGSGIEIFRKRYRKETEPWDWVSLCISTLTTIAGFAMGFAALLGATESWSALAHVYGSLVVGTLAGLDSLGDMIELGGLFGSYEERMEQYLEEERAFDEDNGNIVLRAEPVVTELVFDPSWAEATIDDFRALVGQMNGQRATLTMSKLLKVLHDNELRPKSDSTMKRWLKMAKE